MGSATKFPNNTQTPCLSTLFSCLIPLFLAIPSPNQSKFISNLARRQSLINSIVDLINTFWLYASNRYFPGLTSEFLPRYCYRGKTTVIGKRYVTVINRNYRSHPNRYQANHVLPFPSKSLPRKSYYPIPIQITTVQISSFLWFLVTTQPNTAQMYSSQLPYSKVK